MDQKNILELITLLLKHKKYYSYRKLDKYFYPNGRFELNENTLLEFHNAFGIYVSTVFDHYVWSVSHEFLVNVGLLHTEQEHENKHFVSQKELRVPDVIQDEVSEVLKDTGIKVLPYCYVENKQLFMIGGIYDIDNAIFSNTDWNI